MNAMPPARVGLMGFGRIGRNVMRLLQDREDLEVVAIHDIADPKGLAYLLKYDSLYGRFRGEIRTEDGALIIDDRRIRFGSAKEPKDTDWGADEVDIVLETDERRHHPFGAPVRTGGADPGVEVLHRWADGNLTVDR